MGRSKLQILSGTKNNYIDHSQQLNFLELNIHDEIQKISESEKTNRLPQKKANLKNNFSFGDFQTEKNFNNFIVGPSNKFAVESIRKFIDSDIELTRLFILESSYGLGKSHLTHAISNELKLQNKNIFLCDPILMDSNHIDFIVLKNFDYIIIEDFTLIEDKTNLQNLISHLVDQSETKNYKILISTSNNINELKINERLKQKLKKSICVKIESLDEEIINKYIHFNTTEFPLSLRQNIKRMDFKNFYELDNFLIQIRNYKAINNDYPAFEQISTTSIDTFSEKQFKQVLDTISLFYKQNSTQLLSKERKHEIVTARHACMFFLKEHKHVNVVKIANLFKKDHSSVIYGIKKFKKDLAINLDLKKEIEQVFNDLKKI